MTHVHCPSFMISEVINSNFLNSWAFLLVILGGTVSAENTA